MVNVVNVRSTVTSLLPSPSMNTSVASGTGVLVNRIEPLKMRSDTPNPKRRR